MAEGDIYLNQLFGEEIIACVCISPGPTPSCCFYPAEFFGVLFTENDLPASILINSQIASRSGAEYILDSDPTWVVRMVGVYWFFEIDGVAFGALNCLFGQYDPGYLMEFPWPTSLNASWPGQSVSLTYVPLACAWGGIYEEVNEVIVGYDVLTGNFYANVESDNATIQDTGIKNGNQDSPIGTYAVSGAIGTVTVTA